MSADWLHPHRGVGELHNRVLLGVRHAIHSEARARLQVLVPQMLGRYARNQRARLGCSAGYTEVQLGAPGPALRRH